MVKWSAFWKHRIPKTWRFLSALFLLVCVADTVLPAAEAVMASESKLRAAVIVGIMRFTSWPDAPQFAAAEQINVCLIGQPTSQDYLAPISGEYTVAGKNLRVTEVDNFSLEGCQVLIMGEGVSRKSLNKLLDQADEQGMLTVCDGCRKDLAHEPIIHLVLFKQKVNFNVNLVRAKQTGVLLDAQLLELASSVRK